MIQHYVLSIYSYIRISRYVLCSIGGTFADGSLNTHIRLDKLKYKEDGNISMKRRIFVAGASGAIGRRLCRLLVYEGWSVIGTTRFLEKVPMLRDLGVEPACFNVFKNIYQRCTAAAN